jgi:GT2 family glycosyltransferase
MSLQRPSDKKKDSIAVLLTCHNRKNKTLSCLRSIYENQNWSPYNLTIYLVDDGSTDGTSNEVSRNYPSVQILRGDGNLFWNGGMRLAFGSAISVGYDYYLWLNDDVSLYKDALDKLVKTTKSLEIKNGKASIVIGSTQDPEAKLFSYGGHRKKGWYAPLSYERIEPQNTPVVCDAINGNCVLIPHIIAEKVGNLSGEFTHGAGDYDYSLRAKKMGFDSYVSAGYLGTCKQNSPAGSCRDNSLPVGVRKQMLSRPTAMIPPKEWLLFARHHSGILWPIYWLRTHVRICFPRLWLLLRSINTQK